MLFIKNATSSEIPLIRRIAMEVWPQTYTPIIGESQVAYMLDLFYDPMELKKQLEALHHCFIISYDEDLPVAFASYSETEPKIFKLHKLYTLPQSQGKGIGRQMIDHIVAALEEQNAVTLQLNVNRFNFPAIFFYKKLGFQHLFDEDIDIGNGYFMNDHVLALTIQ